MYDHIDSANEAVAQQQIEHDMRASGLHPVFEELLRPWAPPANDGQQQAQAEPWMPPIEHLEYGGYKHEAALMREALEKLKLTDSNLGSLMDASPFEAVLMKPWRDSIRATIAKLEGKA